MTKLCKYCQGDVRESLPDASYISLEMWIDTDNSILIQNYLNQKLTRIKIKYCPFCGRKLVDKYED